MKIYLDDCLAAKTLAQLLKKAGFEVILPKEVELQGQPDEEHFKFCHRKGYILLTSNPSDFWELHQSNPHHFGIFAVYQDNNPKKDLTFKQMTQVIQKIIKKKIPLKNQFIILNHWR